MLQDLDQLSDIIYCWLFAVLFYLLFSLEFFLVSEELETFVNLCQNGGEFVHEVCLLLL
jgi:hypothetical protein